MARLDEAVFRTKLDGLATLGLPRSRVNEVEAILRAETDWNLSRVNPIRFARTHGLTPEAAIELFVLGAKVGLFDLEWSTLCPYCGALEHRHPDVSALSADKFLCSMCGVDVDVHMDDRVSVSFTLNPEVGELAIDPLATAADYRRHFFSHDVIASPELAAYSAWALLDFLPSAPQGTAVATFKAEAGGLYRLVDLGINSAVAIHATHGPVKRTQLDLRLSPDGFDPREVHVPPGRVTLQVSNRLRHRAAQMLLRTDTERVLGILRDHPPRIGPILSGKALLHNDAFRSFFRLPHVSTDVRLKVRSLTVLFTDLKGSTELYDRIGDFEAYRLVQEHFRVLSACVREHGGAIVKTMGDAIMATFSTPIDGARAAIAMMDRVEPVMGRCQGGGDVALKIGLHEGPALVINAEGRLDYFGQTINVAARVQGLADGREIFVTEAIHEEAGVAEAFRQAGYVADARSVRLKGVGGAARVVCQRRDAC